MTRQLHYSSDNAQLALDLCLFINASPQITGLTFSIEDMASFGIDNVTYAGDGDYPSERAKAEYGVIVFKIP